MRLFILLTIAILSMSGCQRGDKTIAALKKQYEIQKKKAPYVSVAGKPVARKVHFLGEELHLEEGQELKQIALVRHGEPDLRKTGSFTYEEAKQFIRDYDSVGILIPDEPFFMVEENEEVLLVSSKLERARATAKYLFGPDRKVEESLDFREFERALGDRLIRMRLPLRYWTITARLEWLLGIDREGVESFQEAKKRALLGAEKLDRQSEDYHKVVLVAHGFLNRYLKKYLKDMGWEVVRDGGSDYFATTILAKIVDENNEDEGKVRPASVSKMDQ